MRKERIADRNRRERNKEQREGEVREGPTDRKEEKDWRFEIDIEQHRGSIRAFGVSAGYDPQHANNRYAARLSPRIGERSII